MRRDLLSVSLVVALAVAACGTGPAASPSQATSAAPPASSPPSATSGSPSAATGGTVPGTSVSIHRLAEINAKFHPIEGQSNQYMLYYLVFDTLVKLDLTDPALQKLVPDLADKWEISADATTYTFHLHPGVKWQDGTPFTAKDVVFTATWGAQNFDKFIGFLPQWNHLVGAEKALGTKDPIEGVTAPDDNTVVFKLAAPNVEFLRLLSDAPNVIIPEHLLKDIPVADLETSKFITAPVGTGPYKLTKIEPDQFIEFDANPDYFLGPPKIEKFFYKYFAGPEAATAQVQSGDLDILLKAPPTELDNLKANPKLNVFTSPSPGIVALTVQVDNPRWADKRVRQALYYGVDRRGIVQSVLNGQARVLIGPPGFKEYPDLDTYEFNVDKAKQLLKDAKFDFTKPVKFIWDSAGPNHQEFVPVIVQQLEALGLKVDSTPLDDATWNATLNDPTKRDTFDLDISTGGSEGLSPSRSEQYYLCKQPLGASLGYENCDLRNLFEKALTIVDEAQRDEVYHQAAKILNEDVPQMYLWSPLGVHPANKRIGGSLTGVPSFERYVTEDARNWEVVSA